MVVNCLQQHIFLFTACYTCFVTKLSKISGTKFKLSTLRNSLLAVALRLIAIANEPDGLLIALLCVPRAVV